MSQKTDRLTTVARKQTDLWSELAKKAASEKAPDKLVEFVNQLCHELDRLRAEHTNSAHKKTMTRGRPQV